MSLFCAIYTDTHKDTLDNVHLLVVVVWIGFSYRNYKIIKNLKLPNIFS